MKETRLTDNHFCYVLFLEMLPTDFINLLKTNEIVDKLTFLEVKHNVELYQEAKEKLINKNLGSIYFEFDYDSEPFIFNKYINGKLDRPYKICIFEYIPDEKRFLGKTSNTYCNGEPLFFDLDGNMIKNSDN